MDANFVMPRYDSGGFAGLPQHIRASLTGPEKYDFVVLFLVDGFSWRFMDKFQDAAFLNRTLRDGRIEMLTSQFPSTTAAHLTTIHTGMPVGKHGIFEWNYYEPELDAIIAPLLYSYAGTPERDTLRPTGINPQRLFPTTTFYQELKRLDVSTTIFQHREYTPSTFTNIVFSGATVRSYRTLPEALVNLGKLLSKQALPAYFFLYFDKIDALSHEYGPESDQVSAEIENLLFVLENAFNRLISTSSKRTLFLLTADHGVIETDPQTTIYINRDPRFAGFEKFLRTDAQGRPLIPGGSCRDFFLYIREGLVDEAQAFFTSRLVDQAEVRKVADLVNEGYFGPDVSPIFRRRAGDLVLLPHQHETIWWYEKDRFEQRYYGHHGGLTWQEMKIPLISCEL